MRLIPDKIRSISPVEVRTVKKATEASYVEAGGTRVASRRCRASVSQLSKYASVSDENIETVIPVDVAIEIDRASGSPAILATYADILGFELVPKSDASEESELSAMDAHRIGKKATALASEIFAALEDGKTDALERREIISKCLRLVRFLVNLVRRLS